MSNGNGGLEVSTSLGSVKTTGSNVTLIIVIVMATAFLSYMGYLNGQKMDMLQASHRSIIENQLKLFCLAQLHADKRQEALVKGWCDNAMERTFRDGD